GLSGPTETLGIDILDAVVVGVERWKAENGSTILGHAIEVHAEDDGCFEADITARAAGHLLSGEDGHQLLPGLVGVIGPACSDGAERAIPIYAQAGVVMISGTATRTDLAPDQPEPKFFFRTAFTNANEGAEQARYVIARLDGETVYVIDDGTLFSEDLADAAQTELEESGRTVTRESIDVRAFDFSALAGLIAGDSPDVVIFEGFNPGAALLYRQLRDAGYSGPFIGSDAAVSSDFIEPLGPLAEGAVRGGPRIVGYRIRKALLARFAVSLLYPIPLQDLNIGFAVQVSVARPIRYAQRRPPARMYSTRSIGISFPIAVLKIESSSRHSDGQTAAAAQIGQ
ncbi:MAG: branched-chain amino acid ABC transporter substrate-binding protein, partial [Myxococcales bacterium]|nr:branched-chain amino acid ABC transporter substrate-binding protein [Myxococcales bacterium]